MSIKYAIIKYPYTKGFLSGWICALVFFTLLMWATS